MSVIFKLALVHAEPRGIDNVEFTMANKMHQHEVDRMKPASHARHIYHFTCKKGRFVALSILVLPDPTAIYVDEIPQSSDYGV
jgi:hypothetical protein